MTEEEAKTKACFRAATFGASQQLADGPGPHCIGAACMAWRWDNEKLGHSLEYHRQTYGREGERRHAEYLRQNPLRGRCGLAGNPS